MRNHLPFYKSIRFSILAIVLSFVISSTTFFCVRLYVHNLDHIEGEVEHLTETFAEIYHEEIDTFSQNLSISMEALVRNPELVRLFANRNRKALNELTRDFYNQTLKPQYGIKQFQFHLPPALSFLRIHEPSMFGDDLSGFRKTVMEANRTLKPVKGIEVGRAGAGLRLVYPVFYKRKHVGSVELGISLTEILKASAEIAEAEYAIGVYQEVFDNAQRFAKKTSDVLIGDLVFCEFSDTNLRKVLLNLDEKKITVSGRTYSNKSFPLTNFQGEEIGQIVIFKDVSTILVEQRKELLSSLSLIIILTGLLCIALVFLINKAYVKPLKQASELADALADGNLDYHLEISGDSEFKRILKGLFKGLQNLKRMQADTIRSAQLASIGELSASVAHEINNPISGVINYSQILLNQKGLSDNQRDIVAKIQKEGIRVADIVHNLLNYAHDSKGQKSRHDIKAIVANSLALLSPAIKKKGVHVGFSWPETLPEIYCNAQQIEQVLINIFRNAYQALEGNSKDNRIIEVKSAVFTTDNRESLQLTIANNGPHIPPEIVDSILEPFFTTKPVGVGTGLGLSISKTIMEDHNGTLMIRSEPGKMTDMILSFPV